MPWKNKTMIAYVAIATNLGFGAAALADGRYQAVPLEPGLELGVDRAMIIDTVAGHLWIWTESPAVNGNPGGRYLIYQGQVAPGAEMGEVMLKQEWPPEAPAN